MTPTDNRRAELCRTLADIHNHCDRLQYASIDARPEQVADLLSAARTALAKLEAIT